MADKKRNIMRAFKMHEISGVDVPAQQSKVPVLSASDRRELTNSLSEMCATDIR